MNHNESILMKAEVGRLERKRRFLIEVILVMKDNDKYGKSVPIV